MLSKIMQRYKTTSFSELARRVSDQIGSNKQLRNEYNKLISQQRFIPAGNTLLAGIDPIRPNCTIFPSIDENNFHFLASRAQMAWRDRIGIGFDLSNAKDPVNILKKLSVINSKIKLGHRPQRGNMAVLNAKHPKIDEFISCKSFISNDSNQELYNFNTSVGFNEDIDENILLLCSKHAYKCGDPGIVFLDRIQGIGNNYNIGSNIHIKELGDIKTLVPCGEQGMFDNEVCTLGSINLSCSDYWNNGQLNETLFCESITSSVRFLDDVIDKMQLSDAELQYQALNTRRIGLGIMGWSDVLNNLNIKYGTTHSFELADYIGSIFQIAAHTASEKIANEKGVCPILRSTNINRRNITITCIAPTGGITLLTSNKGFGIEPYFDESHSLSPQNHIKMQSVWQKYIDNCISKTINLPNNTTHENILEIWNYAKCTNLKSITIYRDGSKLFQPIHTNTYTAYNCPTGKCDM